MKIQWPQLALIHKGIKKTRTHTNSTTTSQQQASPCKRSERSDMAQDFLGHPTATARHLPHSRTRTHCHVYCATAYQKQHTTRNPKTHNPNTHTTRAIHRCIFLESRQSRHLQRQRKGRGNKTQGVLRRADETSTRKTTTQLVLSPTSEHTRTQPQAAQCRA